MKNITPFQAVLMGVFGLGALIGLFVFATFTGKGVGSGAGGVGTVLVWGTLPKDPMQSMLSLAGQKEPNLQGVSYEERSAATIVNDLAAAIATGNGPDLVLVSQEELLSIGKFIVPIAQSSLSVGTFTNSFIQGAGIFAAQGGYYGVPFLTDPLVLYYNRTLLASNGIARAPENWEALTGLVPTIVQQQAQTHQITRGLIALGTYQNVRNARAILSSLFFQTGIAVSGVGNGGVLAAALGTSGNGGVPSGQTVLNFYTQFADPSKVSYTWNVSLPDSQKAFLSGDLALYIGYASEARFLKAANPNLNFGVSPLPQPATAVSKTVYGKMYALMIPRGAKNPSGAFQAAALLSNAPEQSLAASETGLAPALLAALEAGASDPVASIAASEALYTAGWLSPAPLDTDSLFSSMINNVITGRFTVETALNQAESALTALLQK